MVMHIYSVFPNATVRCLPLDFLILTIKRHYFSEWSCENYFIINKTDWGRKDGGLFLLQLFYQIVKKKFLFDSQEFVILFDTNHNSKIVYKTIT